MNLCIDVGNSTVGVGLFFENKLIKKFNFVTETNKTSHEIKEKMNEIFLTFGLSFNVVSNVVYSSVVPPINHAFKKALNELFLCKILYINSGIKTGVMMKIDNPNEVGNDLIADLVSGKTFYGFPLIIIDLGTASKIMLLDDNGAFSSVLIMPGLKKSAEILTDSTSLLPKISLERGNKFLAKNTIEAMNNGVIYGHAEMIKGLVNRFEKEINKQAKIILTGGCANIVRDLLPNYYIFDEDFILKGLNELIKKNGGDNNE